MNTLAQSIQAILFATAESATIASLATRLGADAESVGAAIIELREALADHGIMLIEQNSSVMLVTRPDQSALIESIRKDELSKELSKASAETLAIIAYTPGIAKSQIEFIRGVNASYTLRSLLMRGLIEAKQEGRSALYYPTLELLQSFGIASIEDLPAYAETKAKIDKLLLGTQDSQTL